MNVAAKRETLNVSTGFGNHIYLLVTSISRLKSDLENQRH